MTDWIQITNTLRHEHGSLKHCERATGISAETLRQLNRGEIKDPRYSTGVKVLAAYEPYRLKSEMRLAVQRIKARTA